MFFNKNINNNITWFTIIRIFIGIISINNTFIGHGVGDATLSTSIHNTGVGANALTSLTSGDYNTALGARAGDAITSGYQNVAIGLDAFGGGTTGCLNVAIGGTAIGNSAETGNQNISTALSIGVKVRSPH